MAKDKRTNMSTDMNEIDLNDASVLTDQEREKMQMSMNDAGNQTVSKKKAM